jgi:2-octaprenyl-6-methoxyphenol hydroxylase
VAGQGLNLGLRDAAELAALVRATPPQDLGSEEFLRRAAAARALDRRAAIGVTDALVRAFGSDHPALSLLRGVGLAALDGVPPARRFFARRMIFGTRALP